MSMSKWSDLGVWNCLRDLEGGSSGREGGTVDGAIRPKRRDEGAALYIRAEQQEGVSGSDRGPWGG